MLRTYIPFLQKLLFIHRTSYFGLCGTVFIRLRRSFRVNRISSRSFGFLIFVLVDFTLFGAVGHECQFFHLVFGLQRLNHFADVAIKKFMNLINRAVNAMVRNASMRKIICADCLLYTSWGKRRRA